MSGRLRAQMLFCALHIAAPLLLGLGIYLSFRRDAWVAVLLGKWIWLPEAQDAAWPVWLAAFLRNYACDMLWAYSLTFAVRAVVGFRGWERHFVFGICVLFAAFTELAQRAGFFPGTFDPLDIILEALSICLALFTIKKYEEAHHETNRANS